MIGRPRTPIGAYGDVSVRPRGAKFQAMTRYRDLDGQLRRVRATATSQRGARTALRERLLARDGSGHGGLLHPSSRFTELVDLWLADLDAQDISEGTRENYRDDVRLHVLPAFAHHQLAEVTTGRVERFLKDEAAVSYSRAKHSRTMLNLLFAFALRHDAIARNPVEGTSPLRKPKHQVRAMTLAQVQAIRAAAAAWRTGPNVHGPRPDGQVRDICEVLLGTAMRPGEVLALRPADITESDVGMVAHVQGTVVERKGRGAFRQDWPKTDASHRRLVVPEFAAQVIRTRVADMGPGQRETTIFHNRSGRVLTLHNLRRTFREFVRDAHLEGSGITPRWYRRTGATVLARGLGVEAAATFLGHTSTAITEAHYIEPDQTLDPGPARILETTLRPDDPNGELLTRAEFADEDAVLDELDHIDDDDLAA